MKGTLTAIYASIIEMREDRSLPDLIGKSSRFLRELYHSRKFTELVSFLVWEFTHRLRLFPKDTYLQFDRKPGLTLEHEAVDALETSESVAGFFTSRGMRLVRSNYDWKVLHTDQNDGLLGCLYSDDKKLYKSGDREESIQLVEAFPHSIAAIFVSRAQAVFVCTRGAVYRSQGGDSLSFEKCLDLSTAESYFRRNYGMTETPSGTLIIGEYGNVPARDGWQNLAYLYLSADGGDTWARSDFLKEAGANKHVHLVRYSQILDKVIVADGDNKKRLWITDSRDVPELGRRENWELVNRLHIQMGGHTSIAESEGKILFGTDYMGGTNFILETTDCRRFTRKVIPDPYRRSPIMQLVQRRSLQGIETWALLPYSTPHSRSLLMVTTNQSTTWSKVIEYRGEAHGVQLIGSSAEPSTALYVSIRDQKTGSRAVYRIVDA